MVNIDYIMSLIDWNETKENQNKGIELARDVKCINVFIQPIYPYSKSVWENCAKILSERSNEELHWYIYDLLEWLQDMNWPGSEYIFERLKLLKNMSIFETAYKYSINLAQKLDDEVWLENLKSLKDDLN